MSLVTARFRIEGTEPRRGTRLTESGIHEDGSGQHEQAMIGALFRTWHMGLTAGS